MAIFGFAAVARFGASGLPKHLSAKKLLFPVATGTVDCPCCALNNDLQSNPENHRQRCWRRLKIVLLSLKAESHGVILNVLKGNVAFVNLNILLIFISEVRKKEVVHE